MACKSKETRQRYLLLPVEQARFLLEQMNQTTRLHLQIKMNKTIKESIFRSKQAFIIQSGKTGEDYLLQSIE